MRGLIVLVVDVIVFRMMIPAKSVSFFPEIIASSIHGLVPKLLPNGASTVMSSCGSLTNRILKWGTFVGAGRTGTQKKGTSTSSTIKIQGD